MNFRLRKFGSPKASDSEDKSVDTSGALAIPSPEQSNQEISKKFYKIAGLLSASPSEPKLQLFSNKLNEWYTREQAWRYFKPEARDVYERLQTRVIETGESVNSSAFGPRYSDVYRPANELKDYLDR